MRDIWATIWTTRNLREKTLIGIAVGLLGLLAFWVLIITPLREYPARQNRALAQAELDLKIMQKGQKIIQQQSGGVVKPVIILTLDQFQPTITNIAKTHRLIITRRQPKGYEELTLWLDDVDAKSVYAWINDLTAGYNIQLSKAQLYGNDDGSIRALITFEFSAQS